MLLTLSVKKQVKKQVIDSGFSLHLLTLHNMHLCNIIDLQVNNLYGFGHLHAVTTLQAYDPGECP
jgi:hypothetical protein